MMKIVIPTDVEWEGSPYKKPHRTARVSAEDATKAFLLCGSIVQKLDKLGEFVELIRARALWVEARNHRENGPEKPEFRFEVLVSPEHLKKEEYQLIRLSHAEFREMNPEALTSALVARLRAFVVERYDERIEKLQTIRKWAAEAPIP